MSTLAIFFRRAVLLAALAAGAALAQQADLDINSPAVAQIKSSMQARFAALAPHFASGAVGLTRDGLVVLRDANAVPLAQRQAVNAAIADENADRRALYREIARANNHPEWEKDIQATFAQRWVARAQGGWWYQDAGGAWKQK